MIKQLGKYGDKKFPGLQIRFQNCQTHGVRGQTKTVKYTLLRRCKASGIDRKLRQGDLGVAGSVGG